MGGGGGSGVTHTVVMCQLLLSSFTSQPREVSFKAAHRPWGGVHPGASLVARDDT